MKFYDCVKFLLQGFKIQRTDWKDKYLYFKQDELTPHFIIKHEDGTEIEWSHDNNTTESEWKLIKE